MAGAFPAGPGQWVWAWVPTSVPHMPPLMPLSPMAPPDAMAPAFPAGALPEMEEILIEESPHKDVPTEKEKIAKFLTGNPDQGQKVPEPDAKKGVTVPPKRKLGDWCDAPTAKSRSGPRPPLSNPPAHLLATESKPPPPWPVILLSWASAAMRQELGTPDSKWVWPMEDCDLKPCSNWSKTWELCAWFRSQKNSFNDFVLWNLHLWKDTDPEESEDSEEPVCWNGNPADPINQPDRYVWKNGDEVRMVCGETVDKKELQLNQLSSLFLEHVVQTIIFFVVAQHFAGAAWSPNPSKVGQRRGASPKPLVTIPWLTGIHWFRKWSQPSLTLSLRTSRTFDLESFST